MDIQRLIAFVVFSFSALLLWDAWQKHNAPHMMSMCCFGATPTFDAACLVDMSFMEAWNSLAYQELRAKHLGGAVHGTVCVECIDGSKTIPIKAA